MKIHYQTGFPFTYRIEETHFWNYCAQAPRQEDVCWGGDKAPRINLGTMWR